MNPHPTTVEGQPKVLAYLRSLDTELSRLPRDDAGELRQQIVDHLADSISATASDAEVDQVLQRLGVPEDLVSESLASQPLPRWRVLRGWGWRRWAALAVAVAAVGASTGYVIDMAAQPSLQTDDFTSGWFYAADGNHAHNEDNANGDETVIRQRPGHDQGFVFVVHNPSKWSETILGPDSHDAGLGNNFQAPVVVALDANPNADLDDTERTDRYLSTPAVIQPGQDRFLRVTWKQLPCQQASAGGVDSENTFGLRVKIGWFTHDQTLRLPQTFATSTINQPNCPNP